MWRMVTCLIICYRIGSTIAIKSGQLGSNADIFMPTFSGDPLYFLVTYIFLVETIIHCSSNLKIGTHSAINFDLI